MFWFAALCALHLSAEEIRVGSKAFTEGYLLGELAARTLENEGFSVTRKFGLGNTGITFAAIEAGEIDVYPEYTGTLREAILREGQTLRTRGLVATESLGFNNTYALAVRAEFARAHQLRTIGDLRKVKVRGAFSHEFAERADGLKGLERVYGLQLFDEASTLEHALAFQALTDGAVDVIDVYSTDAKIEAMDLTVLEDDRGYFPRYEAVFLARAEFARQHPKAWAALSNLAGRIGEREMRQLNARVEMGKLSPAQAISELLTPGRSLAAPGWGERIWRRTKEHALLVTITLLITVLTGVPLGILAAQWPRFAQVLLGFASVVQTIPSLALLCLLIPVLGIGIRPALMALYLYSLLPVILNTHVGLTSIDPELRETARALGLSGGQRLKWIELPLAARSIMAGVRTALVIAIGTATLAALIGAGGYGALIVSGLALNDVPTILAGALPAAGMALAAHLVFSLLEPRRPR